MSKQYSMRSYLILAVGLVNFLLLPSMSKSQSVEWMNLFSSLQYRQGELAVDQQGNLYFFATWNNQVACWPDPNAECADIYSPNYALILVKTNPQGLILNVKTWEPSTFYDYLAQGIRIDDQGQIFLLVENRFFANFNVTHELWKLDSDWNITGQTSVPVNNGVFAQFDVDASGNIYLAYSIDIQLGQQFVDQLRIVKYDTSLTELWTCTLQGSNSDPRVMDIAVNANNKIGLIGRTDGLVSFVNSPLQVSGVLFSFFAVIDATTGLPLVAERLNTYPGINNPTSLNPRDDGSFNLSGTFVGSGQLFEENMISSVAGEYDSYIAKVDENAQLLDFAILEKVIVNRVISDSGGQIVITGQNPSNNLSLNFAGTGIELTPVPRSVFACKLDSNLAHVWSSFWGSTGETTVGNENYQEAGYDLLFAPEGGIYIAGMSKFDDLVIEADTTFDRGRSLFVMKMEDGSSSAGGRVWYDINNNGAQDAGELPYALKALADESGKIIAFTTRSGKYRLPLEEGIHTVLTAQTPNYFDIDPPVRSYVINQTTAPGPDTLDFRLIPQIIAEDVEVVATALGPPVPGQVTRFQIDCRNKGTLPITGTVNLWPDSRLYYSSMNPLGNLDGGRIFWYVNNMPPGDVRTFTADLYVEPMTMLNDQLYSTTAFEGLPGDSNTENNADTITQTVLSSYDPNDKQVDKPAVLHLPTDAGLLSQDFEYLIRFQNTGTYMAFKIVVRDTLSELLDPLSFNLISVSHPVEIRVEQGRILEFVFNNILLPDSTSNEPESHGFIKYTLRPLAAQIQVGDRINNTAHIYFDYNASIATNTATTAIEQVTSLQPGQQFPATLLVFPNPVTNTLYIEHKGAIPDGPVTLTIVDAAGKRLVNTPWQSTLSVETLPPGMYTLLLKYEGRTWAACPFLKK